MTKKQLEVAILSDVVTRFVNMKESTSRRTLLIKFRGQPVSQALADLLNQNILRRKNFYDARAGATSEEQYLPTAATFQFCGNTQLRDQMKLATTTVFHALQQMFVGEQKKDGLGFEDLKNYIANAYPNQLFDNATLKIALYLAKDFGGVLAMYGLNPPDDTEVTLFQIGEGAISMADPENEWDRVMAGYRLPSSGLAGGVDDDVEGAQGEVQWEQIRHLGGGGQSDVFLVRSPVRVSQRASHLQTIGTAQDQDKRAELADAIWSYARPDSLPELGAMKIFKIREDGDEQQALDRLKREIQVLQQNRPGLPKLLDSNEAERWIVTEYFPRGTVEDNISLYKGKPALALKAFLSLVNTVALLHDEDIVHRDIKPANVFVRQDEDLVLGDFGIVYLPDQPARLTRTNESVGPHDYMPPWADTGGRLDKVDRNFDVYMLGKLLWCMVSGRLLLKREWFRRPQNDISVTFDHDPHAYMINIILEKCVVERPQDCISIGNLRDMVNAYTGVIEQGGQLLREEVPRPCHVCGFGTYRPELLRQSSPAFNMRFWGLSGGSSDINIATVQLFVCSSCGHIEFFRTSPR